jgi:hypothetical protein
VQRNGAGTFGSGWSKWVDNNLRRVVADVADACHQFI